MKPGGLSYVGVIAAVFYAATAINTVNEARAAPGDLYVSPTGADTNSGTKDAPLATLEAARNTVRRTIVAGSVPAEGMTIWIHGGRYQLQQPFELTAADSGTTQQPVIYRAVEGEQALFSNSATLSASEFQAVTDAATLERIAPAARGKVVELDLKKIGAKHIASFPDVFGDTGNIIDLFVNGRRMSLSRSPEGADLTIKRVLDNTGGPAKPSGVVGGTFEYRDEAVPLFNLWAREIDRGLWLKGFWRVMWQNEAIRVKSIDLQKHTVTFAKSIPGGIGNKYHRPQGNGKEQYWAINLPEGIDRPGQWCLDFTDQKLLLYPPDGFDKAEIYLADSDSPVIWLHDASNVVLRGVTVQNAMGDGIRVDGGHDDLIAGCTVRDVDKYAVIVDGGVHHTVQSCDLYDLGCGGVWLSGGDDKSNPRVPAGHRVINNHIHHFSQIVKVYTPAVNCGYVGGSGGGHHPAVGMYVANNLIHDTPHGGILYGSFDSVFEYNEIFRYCMVSNDLGAFYSYDTYALDGNQTFRYNLCHGTVQGDGLYWDNDHRQMHVYGNIVFLQSIEGMRGTGFLYKIGTQAKSPTSIECYNNIAIGCNTGYEFVSALPDQGKIENNVAVMCRRPFDWRLLKNGKSVPASFAYATGKNMTYSEDPGFVDMARLDFHLKPDSQLMRDLPQFQAIPVDKIGLHVDEYRQVLPSDNEIDRFSLRSAGASGYETEDR
jgi:hypothetical protein